MIHVTNKKLRAMTGFGIASAMGAMLLAAGALSPVQAQYCPASGTCSNRTIEAVPSNPYQLYIAGQAKAPGTKRGVKSVLLFDQAPGHGDGKQALRRSLSRLSQKYGFKLVINDVNGYITPTTLAGVDIVVFSQGDGDVLGGLTSASTVAMENFTYAQGGSVMMVHAAAAYIQCTSQGGSDLANANCRFLARVAARQYLQHQADNTPVRIYADSVFAQQVPPYGSLGATNNLGPVPAAAVINHGRRNDETKNIFDNTVAQNAILPPNAPTDSRTTVWDGVGCEWYNYSSSPRTVGAMSRTVSGTAYTEGRVNILLSMDELSRNIGSQRMGDHPQAWTRKMGNGLGLYQNAGHSDIYIRVRGSQSGGSTLPGGVTSNDSLIEKINWNMLRYLARDYVGCMDPNYLEFNPNASVARLTDADPVQPCVTTVSVISRATGRNSVGGITMTSRGFEIKTPEAGFYRVSVTDAAGRSVYSKTIVGGHSKSVNVSDLSKGSYFVRVTNPAKSETSVRVDI